MKLDYISLCDFRNIECQTLEFTDGVNILYGMNAQGKTNAIEAAYMFACGKSFRAVKNNETVRHNTDLARLACEFREDGAKSPTRLKIEIYRRGIKRIYKNNIRLNRLSEFLGLFRVVLFCPEHLSLVKDGPKERRAFIDAAICQLKPRYAALLHEYSTVAAHRSALLRKIAQSGRDDGTLEIWNSKLAEAAAGIIPIRREYISELSSEACLQYGRISNGREKLVVKYRSDMPAGIAEPSEMKEFYIKLFEDTLKSDLKYGFTTHGLVRDDLTIEVDSKSARSFCSQGQQRSCVLALKLAEGELSKRATGEYPVLLFDDILSELDSKRQSFILSELEGKQVILTDCSKSSFKGLDVKNKILVRNGEYMGKQ